MQNQFLILVALTPKHLLTPLRKSLQMASLNSLKAIKYDNFKVLLLGDEEKQEGHLHFLKAPEGKKGIRLAFALRYIAKENLQFDYLARFDDDDILNSEICKIWENEKSDCLADLYHCFYDLGSDKVISTKRTWLANTVFLKREHATAIMKDGRTLIEQDHAAEWQNYFESKSISYAKKERPIYMRVLSPTSITASDNDNSSYADYLNSFGNWNQALAIKNFQIPLQELERIHQEHFSDFEIRQGNVSVLDRIKRVFSKD